ncbi:hypothetical protein [Porphyrobacter sp. CACIAM 03H1]|uniref:hypothetical protein n=1 Tax=Porphyrobacter sp. CACIAM 03H1 TaxID=2003315 RepID=UPI000B5AAC2D|nr:hypothetical protein [Porphyrobacter sp. CACIAM 03H1]ASJ91265.1 hypothetical protein CBR61_10300 [Porphyrobacter sp. CACIAM 03H1]
MRYLAIGLLVLAAPATAQESGNRLSLICAGGGYATKLDQSTAQAWNNYGDSATATVQSPSRVGFQDQTQLWVEGSEGRIRMPPSMLPAIRGGEDGWFKLSSIEVTDSEIRATVKVNPLNNPKLRLDRITGAVSLSGKAGDYAGRCQKFDPQAVQRQF